jgi:hypothetical protein
MSCEIEKNEAGEKSLSLTAGDAKMSYTIKDRKLEISALEKEDSAIKTESSSI